MSSIIPLVVDLVDRPFKHPSCCGLGLQPHGLHSHVAVSHPEPADSHSVSGHSQRPIVAQHRVCTNRTESPLATISTSKDGFQVVLDVEHFAPHELSVKTVDNTILVEGKHEERKDAHGHIFRHFIRRYRLPGEFNIDDVYSTLSSDGVLTIKTPPAKQSTGSNIRVIQIQQTGPSNLGKQKPNNFNDDHHDHHQNKGKNHQKKE